LEKDQWNNSMPLKNPSWFQMTMTAIQFKKHIPNWETAKKLKV
jgi:hypothetical protein